MDPDRGFSQTDLDISCEVEVRRIVDQLRGRVVQAFRKNGFVVALSGGVDSSVVAALCVRAAGKDGVVGLVMPERESSPDSRRLASRVGEWLDIRTAEIDITGVLEALGCYARRDSAIRRVVPEYGSDYSCKLVLPGVLESDRYRLYSIVVEAPDGRTVTRRLPRAEFLQIMAASNFKQRVRKMFEYYHADRLNYLVAGTPNRLEYELGFFVKAGDGVADVKPIAHLYKTQVYRLAEFLEVPSQIRARVPTTDTYPLSQSQEEFFFSVPYQIMDLCLYGKDHGYPIDQVAAAAGLTVGQVHRVNRDIEWKRRSSRYLRAAPVLIEGAFDPPK